MECRQAREAFEEVLDGKKSWQDFPGLEQHLDQCPECQEWYARERQAIEALQKLEVFPAPPDFTERVLSQLPDTLPRQRIGLDSQAETALRRLRLAWDSLLQGLTSPRRRLAPLLAVAASLLLVLGLAYVLWGEDVVSTPGAAMGASPWTIGISVGLVVVVLVVAVVLWRRKG